MEEFWWMLSLTILHYLAVALALNEEAVVERSMTETIDEENNGE